MKGATLRQAKKILGIFDDTPCEQVQAMLDSGLLADLRDGNIDEIDRNEFRKLVGLGSFSPNLDVWRTINVGSQTRSELISMMTRAGMAIEATALQLMESPSFTYMDRSETETVDLGLYRVRVLGFNKAVSTFELFSYLKKHHHLCPPEVGPHLRLDYDDQPKRQSAWLAMNPISCSSLPWNDSMIFCLQNDAAGNLVLGSCNVTPELEWDPDDYLIIALNN